MGELKFRAWNKKQRLMVYFNLYNLNNGMLHSDVRPDMAIEKCAIMQYTGLKDKKGKEIYEGDILLIEDTYKDRILEDGSGPTEPANHLAPVIYDYGTYGLHIKERGETFNIGFWSFERICSEGIWNNELEVIGNIYENKELLEGK